MDIQKIVKSTGGQFTFGLADIPAIAGLRDRLYAKVLSIPWVDKAALKEAFLFTENGAVWSPNYAINSKSWNSNSVEFTEADLLSGIPEWLREIKHAIIWNKLNDFWRNNVMPVLALDGKKQAEVLLKAINNAVFWNSLYAATKFVAEIPGKVATSASKVVGSVFAGLIPIFIMGGVIFVAYVYSRSQYRKVN